MDDNDDFWEGLAALLLGFAGVALFVSWMKPRCPQCNEKLEKGTPVCPTCGSYLRWESNGY